MLSSKILPSINYLLIPFSILLLFLVFQSLFILCLLQSFELKTKHCDCPSKKRLPTSLEQLQIKEQEQEQYMVVMEEFDYEELKAATEGFSPSRLIGKGSHGFIYKGTLKNGKLVAVKTPSSGLRILGDNSKLDNEIRILSSLPENPYLIKVLGASHDSATNMVLVMELMPNGSLHDSLHAASSIPPTWPKRVEIAVRLARALQFLHDAKPLVIHRDIKSANVLFDSNWNSKLADFGLAIRKHVGDQYCRVDSPSQPAGTMGYLDPCYITPSKLSTKNDVFSFGVVLLEIISGQKAIDIGRAPTSITEWAMPLIKGNRIVEICDSRIALPTGMEGMIKCMLYLASRCVSLNENYRPTIGEIVMELENCFIQPLRFPIWLSLLKSVALLRKQRQIALRGRSTKAICAAPRIGKCTR